MHSAQSNYSQGYKNILRMLKVSILMVLEVSPKLIIVEQQTKQQQKSMSPVGKYRWVRKLPKDLQLHHTQ